MFAGHIGTAMAIARMERRINVGVFILAAVLLDVVLWIFVLLGWEFVTIPADFTATHQPQFVFPYSHGLLASICWSLLGGIAVYLCYSRLNESKVRAGALIAVAIFSHWLLDAAVHAPELPIAGNGSAKVGLWLWHAMPVALVLEGLIAIAGLCLFLTGVTLSRASKFWLSALCIFILVSTVAGMTITPAPSSGVVMAMSSLVSIALVCALAGWLARDSR